jgi:uncharacterized protein (DUF1330 family)
VQNNLRRVHRKGRQRAMVANFVMPVTSQCRSQDKRVGVYSGENAMKKYFLTLVLAAFFSAVAIRGPHALTTTPPVYVVIEIDEITDADGFEALRHTADATAIEVQFEDGRYFASTEKITALDGSAPKFFAFIAFDNITKAKTFIDSIKATTALRTRVSKSRAFIVEGTSQLR